jgi:hypothetical protein
MKTIIATSAAGLRALHHLRPAHQQCEPMRTNEIKSEVVLIGMGLVILLAFTAYFDWYLFTLGPQPTNAALGEALCRL